jgi:hypothetical protein
MEDYTEVKNYNIIRKMMYNHFFFTEKSSQSTSCTTTHSKMNSIDTKGNAKSMRLPHCNCPNATPKQTPEVSLYQSHDPTQLLQVQKASLVSSIGIEEFRKLYMVIPKVTLLYDVSDL